MTDEGALEPLAVGEVLLTDDDEIVFRQCSPKHIDKRTNQPSDLMFRATDADKGQVSASRSSKVTPEQAYLHWTTVLKRDSAGTYGVSVSEIASAGSRAIDDSSIQPDPKTPGHVYIDARHLQADRLARQRFRSTLLIAALRRRRLHPADSPSHPTLSV